MRIDYSKSNDKINERVEEDMPKDTCSSLGSLIYLVLEKEDDRSREWLSILVNGCHSY